MSVIALSSPTTNGSSTYSKCGEHTISLVKTDQTPSSSKAHASLSPKINLLLICVWAIFVVFAFGIIQPRLPFSLAIAGGFLGVLAGVMQHLSISHDPNEFVAASSLMGVRRALTSTPWGRKYIAWLYFSKAALILIAFLLIKGPLYQVVLGYLVAYVSLMLVRDTITLRDTFALQSLQKQC
jgi:hypothetical protein